jgi:hypothetical protein
MFRRKTRQTIPARSKRPIPITIIGLLLLIQAIFMFALGIYHFVILSFGPELLSGWLSGQPLVNGEVLTFNRLVTELFSRAYQQQVLSILTESLVLFLLTGLAILAGIGFFRMWRFAWLQAMAVQGSGLLLALVLYYIKKPRHIYLLMLSGIFMVVYLNYGDIKSHFQLVPKAKGLKALEKNHER